MTRDKSQEPSRGHHVKWATITLLSLLVAPPIISLVFPDDSRLLDAVELDETSYREVEFRNDQQSLNLAGMLFEPSGEGPFPAAVIIHGSGTSRRDNGWYLTVASHLQEHGVAVLLPDKRGSEQSDGDWGTASFEDLATDTEAAITYLMSQDDVAIGSVGVIGMSQGGRIAPIVAGKKPDVSWVVNVVGDAVPAHESLRYEEKHNLREMGFLPVFADLIAVPSAWSMINLRDSGYWDAVGNFDPIPYWEAIIQPSLIIYGEEDTNVPTEASVERLETLEKGNIEITVYSGSGHAIEDPEGTGHSIFREDALDDLVAFIRREA